ncbi:hypothetical protein AAG570_002783 [Ranatra chinensis]|uniref:RING-type domain-containing protein n=1 Tax=Ranatra chinensis TaxID=642074 RepID=A0ABD0YJ83_9HEMI
MTFWIEPGGRRLYCKFKRRIRRIYTTKVSLPFTFKIQDTESSSERLVCLVSSRVDYHMEAYWGVRICDVLKVLKQSSIPEELLLKECCQHVDIFSSSTSHDEKYIVLSRPESFVALGPPPRDSYPLLVILKRDTPGTPQPVDMLALISLIHVKDSLCTLPTAILAQYLKNADGSIWYMEKLYFPSGEDGVEQKCVVCQNFPLSRVILPCRHTCVCAYCFRRLKACPMCRTPIKSYFCVCSEDYMQNLDKPGHLPFANWLHNKLTNLHRWIFR